MTTVDNTFAQDIEEAAGDEEIIGCVIGEWHSSFYNEKGIGGSPSGTLLEWDDARKYLDYTYDSSWGTADCHPIMAWTDTRVLFTREYDGATWIASALRNPTSKSPGFM